MNKLFNWTFGSFFRTLGRFLFYLLIGFLITQLINISDVKLPSFFDVLNVYAYETWPSSQTINLTVNGSALSTTSKLYRGSGTHSFRIYSDEAFVPTYSPNYTKYNYGYISVCVSSSFNISTFSAGYFTKDIKFIMTSVPCQIYNTTAYPDSVVMYITFEMNIGPSNTNRTMCTSGSSSTLCGLDNSFDVYVPRNVEYTLNSYGFSLEPFIFDTTTSTLINQNQVIINQNNQIINKLDSQSQQQHQDSLNVQDKIDDVNDTLNDDNIDNNSISNFVNTMDDEPSSLTPFSDFINLPLTWVQSLLASNQNCQTIQLPLPFLQNKTLDLPCMTDFWNRMGALKTLIELVWIAIVGVRIFNGLFLLTCDVIDPNPDKDMTKLRTWEL